MTTAESSHWIQFWAVLADGSIAWAEPEAEDYGVMVADRAMHVVALLTVGDEVGDVLLKYCNYHLESGDELRISWFSTLY